MKVRKALLLLSLVYSFEAFADYSAKVYEMGSGRKKELFALNVMFSGTGSDEKAVATYSDTNTKEVALVDTAVLRGEKFIKGEIEQKQINVKATMEVRDGSVYFTKTADGKTESENEKLKGDFVTSSNFQRFVKSKWADVMADKSVDFRFGVWDRLETVGFTIKKIAESGEGDKKVVTVKMKASNFIIAALVNPLEFKFSHDGGRILELVGRVAPKQKKDGKWVDLDAEMVYSYP